MQFFSLLFWLVVVIHTNKTSAEIKCKNTIQCNCIEIYREQYEIQCPPKNSGQNGIVINIENKRLIMDCYDLRSLDSDLVPYINETDSSILEIKTCPLSKDNFKTIIQKLINLDKILSLNILYSNFKENNLDRSFISGLENLKSLKLNFLGNIHMDQHFFESCPNLLHLEIYENNFELKPGIFDAISNLSSIEIVGNQYNSIPDNLFNKLWKLVSLHFRQNGLVHVTEKSFSGLINLEILELSSNKISNLSQNVFHELKRLKSISLRNNNLNSLPVNLFEHNKLLEVARFGYNPLEFIPNYLFANRTNLKQVEFAHCNLKILPAQIFYQSQNLENIYLNHNQLSELSTVSFQGLKMLKILFLNNNKLSDLNNVFITLNQLEILDLSNNLIKTINALLFDGLMNLRVLNLKKNKISHIDPLTFYFNTKLVRINLSFNNYSNAIGNDHFLESLIFNRLTSLKILEMSHNNLTAFPADLILNKINLEMVNMSYNKINNIKFEDLQSVSNQDLTVDLSNNDISSVTVPTERDNYPMVNKEEKNFANLLLDLKNNPLKCDCHLYGFVKYLKRNVIFDSNMVIVTNLRKLFCHSPLLLNGVRVKDLKPSQLRCPLTSSQPCSDICDCYLRPDDKALIVDCSFKNLISIPKISISEDTFREFNHTEFLLNGNKLIEGPTKEMPLFLNVTKLFLENNTIRTLSWLPPKLEVLQIENNSLRGLNNSILYVLNSSRVSKIGLHDNPWLCDCNNLNLIDFLHRNPKKLDSLDIFCDGPGVALIELSKNDICHHEWNTLYILLMFLTIFLIWLAVIIFILIIKKQVQILERTKCDDRVLVQCPDKNSEMKSNQLLVPKDPSRY